MLLGHRASSRELWQSLLFFSWHFLRKSVPQKQSKTISHAQSSLGNVTHITVSKAVIRKCQTGLRSLWDKWDVPASEIGRPRFQKHGEMVNDLFQVSCKEKKHFLFFACCKNVQATIYAHNFSLHCYMSKKHPFHEWKKIKTTPAKIHFGVEACLANL